MRVPASAFCLAALLAASSAAWAPYRGPDAAGPATHARLHPHGGVAIGRILRADRERPGPQPTGCAEPRCGLRGSLNDIATEP